MQISIWIYKESETTISTVTLQSLPEGIPPLVMPSLEKQDIPQMKKDLPKYDAAGVYTPQATLCWENLLAEFPSKYGKLPEHEPPWIVEGLLPSIRARDDLNVFPQVVLPEKVSQKVKAAQEHRQVIMILHQCIIIFSGNDSYTQ